jgi:transposase
VVHQLCCQHLLRDADDAAQVYPDEHWPAQIGDAIRGLIHATNLARDQDHHTIDAAARDELCRLLRDGVLVGLSRTTSHGNRPGERKARLLLEAFRDRPEDILRFTTNLDIPPTSNDAERELRPSKIQQNTSGRLTSTDRTKDRYTILGYLNTAAKHGQAKMTALRDAVLHRPWMPAHLAPT